MTVWEDVAKQAPQKFAGSPIVVFKRTRVSNYAGRALSGSGFKNNPSTPEANGLKSWWAANGNRTQSRSLSTQMEGAGEAGARGGGAEVQDVSDGIKPPAPPPVSRSSIPESLPTDHLRPLP